VHIQNPKKINFSYNFVRKVGSLERRYNLFLNLCLSLSIILFFWSIVFFIRKRIIFTEPEFIILLILPLFSLLKIFNLKGNLHKIGKRLESLLLLEGRLFLAIDVGEGKKIYGSPELIRKALNESDNILKPLKPADFVERRKNAFYYAIFGISILLICLSHPRLPPSVNIYPAHIPEYTFTHRPCLITARSNAPTLYLIWKNKKVKMIKMAGNRFGFYHTLSGNKFSIGYRGWRTGVFSIPVAKNFRILRMKKRYRFPAYIHIPDIIDTTFQTEIAGIQGTKIDFSLEVSPKPYKAYMKSMSKEIPLAVSGQTITGGFFIKNNKKIKIEADDSLRIPFSLLEFSIFSVKDNPPGFTFISPKSPYKLGKDMRLDMVFKIEDDFYIKRAYLRVGRMKTKISGIKGKTLVQSEARFNLSNMLPGDTLEIYGVVEDAIGQVYITPPFIVYLPHLEQMLSSISEFGKSMAEKTAEAERSQQELKKAIEEMIDKGVQNWEDRKVLHNTLNEQEKLLKKISRIKDMMETLKNPEIRKEMERIKEIYQEMDIQKLNKEIRDVMKEGQKSNSLEKIDISQEELLKALKMGKELLEKLAKLMKMDEYYQSLENIRKAQENISKTATKNPASQSEKQSKLGNKMDMLLKDMKSSAYKEIKNIGQEGAKKNIPGNMKKLSKSFAKGKNNKGTSQKIENDIRSLMKMLLDEQNKELGAPNIMAELKKIVLGLRLVLNEVDVIYENPYLKSGVIDALTNIYNQSTRLFMQSMAFSPKVLTDLSGVIKGIQTGSRIESIKYKIDEVILMLLETGKKGKSSLLSELAKMLQQQQGMGEKMQALIPMPAPQRMGALKKMAGQERSMAKKMGKLGDAFSSIAEEMKKLADELAAGKLNKEEIQMHQKILKHLLEAERSVRRRSFAKKRRSSPGKYYPPPEIKITRNKGERYYYERLLIEKYKDEPVSDVFKKAVKEYYERLLK